ncbi:hypothetical protein BKA70DRAFT_1329044, partial [Coprinopsis sp. MPI-PUGE-AT-0042]
SSTLPPEVWQVIFSNATPPFHNVHFHYHQRDLKQRRIRNAIVTKGRIAQVCHGWRLLVEPMLYEHLVISRTRSLDAIRRVLQVTRSDGRTKGELVKRLDITFKLARNQFEGMANPPVSTVFCHLMYLLDLLPNLRVLLIRNSFSYMVHICDALKRNNFFAHISPSLEEIAWIDDSWRNGLLKIPEPIWSSFLHSHPNLKSIHWPGVDIPSELYWDDLVPSLLTSPMTQVTQMIMRLGHVLIAPTYAFPNLRHVLFDIPYVGPMAMEMMQGELPVPTMLEGHGHKITSMDCLYERAISERCPQVQYFPMIARHCPNLEEFGLFHNWTHRSHRDDSGGPYDDLPWNFTLPCTFPSVKKLKVRRMYRRFDLGAYQEMLEFVRKTVVGEDKKLPNCTTVQFDSERDVIYLLKHKEHFLKSLSLLAEHKIGLLNHKGQAFMVPGAK